MEECLSACVEAPTWPWWAAVGATLLWLGSLLQLSQAMTDSWHVLNSIEKPLSELAKEEHARFDTRLTRRWAVFVPGRAKRLQQKITEVADVVLTVEDRILIDRHDRESRGWTLVLLSSVVAISVAVSEALRAGLAGVVVAAVLLLLSFVFVHLRRREDDKLYGGSPGA